MTSFHSLCGGLLNTERQNVVAFGKNRVHGRVAPIQGVLAVWRVLLCAGGGCVTIRDGIQGNPSVLSCAQGAAAPVT